MGGSDPNALTSRVLAELSSFPIQLEITAVIGDPRQLSRLRELAGSMSHVVDIRVAERDMAGVMSRTDVAISAAGSTVWELCCMGIPMLLSAQELNQSGVLRQAAMAGAALPLDDLEKAGLHTALRSMISDGSLLESMSRAGQGLVDGQGAARVSEVILNQ
ncbi:MAG: glycosyltransferase [Actinomycetota bacterium]|nr:glycosyltransferase [Actinomycetota bacterium]